MFTVLHQVQNVTSWRHLKHASVLFFNEKSRAIARYINNYNEINIHLSPMFTWI